MILSKTAHPAIHLCLTSRRWCAPRVSRVDNATPAGLRQNPSSVRRGSSIQANFCISIEPLFALVRLAHSVASYRDPSTLSGSVPPVFPENHRSDPPPFVRRSGFAADLRPESPASHVRVRQDVYSQGETLIRETAPIEIPMRFLGDPENWRTTTASWFRGCRSDRPASS